MQIPKPTDADRARFTSLVPDDPRVAIKPMFGNVAAFVNGNMFMGLFGADVGIKLDAAQLKALRAEPGAGAFGPAERPMSGYVTLPADLSTRAARAWTGKALAYVATLPPKQPKATKAAKPAKAATTTRR